MQTQNRERIQQFVFSHLLQSIIAMTMRYFKFAGVDEWMDLPLNASIETAPDGSLKRVQISYLNGIDISAETLPEGLDCAGEPVQRLNLRWFKDGESEAKIAKLQKWCGPGNTCVEGQYITLSLCGDALEALEYNAEAQRLARRTYRWDHPEHPRHF